VRVEAARGVVAPGAGAGVWEQSRARGDVHLLGVRGWQTCRGGGWRCFGRGDGVGRCGGMWCLGDRGLVGIHPGDSGRGWCGAVVVCDFLAARKLALDSATHGHL
jgi:hypothetical protein